MKHEFHDDVLTLYLEGQVNSVTSPEIEEEIEKILKECPHCGQIVFDLGKVTYLSSAGLRVLLKYHKRCTARVQEASVEVYDVLEMTGFTSIMSVRRKLLEVDVSGAKLIGTGFFSDVYRLDKDTIIKVFRGDTTIDNVERELGLAKQAFVLGIPTAISFDVVRVKDRLGVRFEMLDCASLRDLFRDHQERYDELVKKYAELLLKINQTESIDPTLPDAKQRWMEKVEACERYLDKPHGQKLRALIESIPDRDTFVHGDCHYKNIMVQNGELLLIDMDTLCKGHPIFELASIYAPYVAFEEAEKGNTERFMGLSSAFTQKIFHDVLDIYFGKHDDASFAKIGLVSYCHMIWWNDVNDPTNKTRHDVCLDKLTRALDAIDDLDIGK